jgi:hypothetical protein
MHPSISPSIHPSIQSFTHSYPHLPIPVLACVCVCGSGKAWEREWEKPKDVSYMDGTLMFYGSTIALQSTHGGFLCLDAKHGINAAAVNQRQPNVLMKVCVCVCVRVCVCVWRLFEGVLGGIGRSSTGDGCEVRVSLLHVCTHVRTDVCVAVRMRFIVHWLRVDRYIASHSLMYVCRCGTWRT